MSKRWEVNYTLAVVAVLSLGLASCEYLGVEQESPYSIGDEAMIPMPVNDREPGPYDVIVLSQPATETQKWLDVRSPDFGHNEPIPERFTGFGQNNLPTLRWSGVPEGTQSFVVIVEDPDARDYRPFTHLITYNIPPDQREITANDIRQGVNGAENAPLIGRNSTGTLGYLAPTPPMGDAAHTYHFEVFALDTMLDLPAGVTRADLINAMQGHVLAKGETIGTYKRQ